MHTLHGEGALVWYQHANKKQCDGVLGGLIQEAGCPLRQHACRPAQRDEHNADVRGTYRSGMGKPTRCGHAYRCNSQWLPCGINLLQGQLFSPVMLDCLAAMHIPTASM